ncbi:MAG: TIGR04282 family arsenosugar biosynthesis glycosyltransferase [Terriglobia bacterium]
MSNHSRISQSISPRGKALAVAIFARAPSPGRTKTRLIPLLGARGAADFQAALLSDAVRKVRTLRGRIARYLFLAGGDSAHRQASSNFTLLTQRGRDLGERLTRAFHQLLRGHPAAVVIGTDSPLLAPKILRQAMAELRVAEAVLGPCPDGGYYLIGLRRLSPSLLARIRWGTARAFDDTLRNLLKNNFCVSILEPLADVDRPEDFRSLAKELIRSAAARRAAPAVWKFVKARGGAGNCPRRA